MNQEEQHILQKNLIDHIVHNVFNSITDEDVLIIKSNKDWFLKGKRLDEERIQSLRDSAISFSESSIWKLLYGELQYHALLRASEAKTEADLVGVKEMKRIMSIMRKLLERMSVN